MVPTNGETRTRGLPVSRVFDEFRKNPVYWLLVFVPGVLVAERLRPEAHTALFLLSVSPSFRSPPS
jgi:hypothetical protein